MLEKGIGLKGGRAEPIVHLVLYAAAVHLSFKRPNPAYLIIIHPADPHLNEGF